MRFYKRLTKYQTKQIRNIALVSHNGAGKTTFVERLLFDTQVTTRMGQVDNGSAAMDFEEEEKAELLALVNSKPTITIMSMGRPPVIPEINAASNAMIADFENEDDIILELIYGKFNPTGKLPIEIPSSMEAVENQMEDMPYDSKDPLYPFGYGLSY